ncbi:MmgE/PrpD family protein [Nocardia sp. alder85J]|uniref:MmgE/PrpD family protein n=1 Tax=Nocardia sp. alder85J TaxID=2862949 RepID=UPI001CD62A43|nr:MmgE/PrpD family protein [Nocardia sp. alder85J]MCX4095559.1 MmgE/PrpD family protein [Nocardia sp. alder85J]
MAKTIVEQLAGFTAAVTYDRLPAEVVVECKRILLDSLGCALGAVDQHKGRIGIEFGRMMGPGDATIIGTGERATVFGAAFANGELINALDFDAVLPPGHVTPFVLPPILAIAETGANSGPEVLAAIALAHELSFRFYKSMDYLRDRSPEGTLSFPPVLGYSNTVFGATAAVGKLGGFAPEVLAHALAIAASTSPVNSQRSWTEHAPSATIKYSLAGALTQAALTAAYLGKLGHRGDLPVLDDAEFGYRRFIGSRRWEPGQLLEGLGESWLFPAEQSFKPYPHCRILHAPLHALTEIVEQHDLRPGEIDAIRCWGEAAVMYPLWLSNVIEHTHDAQFSIAHGLAVGAHRVTPSKAWHDPQLVFGRSVLDLMDKVTFAAHPDYLQALAAHPSARPARVEVDARGTTFVAERHFPKGSPTPDPTTRATDDELIAKFRINATGVLSEARMDDVVAAVFELESVADFATVMRDVVAVAPWSAV